MLGNCSDMYVEYGFSGRVWAQEFYFLQSPIQLAAFSTIVPPNKYVLHVVWTLLDAATAWNLANIWKKRSGTRNWRRESIIQARWVSSEAWIDSLWQFNGSYLLNPYLLFTSLALSTSTLDNALCIYAISLAASGIYIWTHCDFSSWGLYRSTGTCTLRTGAPYPIIPLFRPLTPSCQSWTILLLLFSLFHPGHYLITTPAYYDTFTIYDMNDESCFYYPICGRMITNNDRARYWPHEAFPFLDTRV